MSLQEPELSGPEFSNGVMATDAVEGKPLLGQVNGEGVILVRRRDECFAVGASCTHYGGPLAEGLVEGDTVRCALGTTLGSTCERGSQLRQPSTPCLATPSSSVGVEFTSARENPYLVDLRFSLASRMS